MIRKIRTRFGSLILAFILAVAVWVAAENDQDPMKTALFPQNVPIEYLGLEEGLLVTGEIPSDGTLTLRAPTSAWDELTAEGADRVRFIVTLTGLSAGVHMVPVVPEIDHRLVHVVAQDPTMISISLERSLSERVPVSVLVSGEPVVGYRVDEPTIDLQFATVSGPASAVERVVDVVAVADAAGRAQDLFSRIELTAIDVDGLEVEGVVVDPDSADVQVPIVQRTGYRTVAVVPITEGNVAAGYRVTNISVSPTLVTLRSSDPQAVDFLPGFVETEPVNLNGGRETVERRVLLDIPEGFSIVGEQSVLVQVSIAVIESSITITRTLEIQGLDPLLQAQAAPETVSLILTGPLPTLEELQPQDVRVVINLFDYEPGIHQVTPEVLDLPGAVRVQTFLPESIEVTITEAPPATSTPPGP